LKDTVGVDIKSDLNLRLAARHRRNARELELAQQVVVASHTSLTFVDLNEYTRLVIGEGREDLSLLRGNGSVARNEHSHDATSGLQAKGERSNVEQEDVVELLVLDTSKNGGLDSSTIGDGLIGVNGLVELLAVEEVLEELLDLGNTSRATDQDDLVDLSLVELRVSQDLLDGLQARAEKINVELLELSASDGGVEVLTFVERVNLDGGLSRRRQSALRALAGSSETTKSTSIAGDVEFGALLELINEEGNHAIVEVLATQVSVTSRGLDLEDSLVNGEQRDVECSTTQVKDENVALATSTLVETIGNGGSSWLVDDAENVEARDVPASFVAWR